MIKMVESSLREWKTLWEKEKLLFTSNFSFSYSVFKRLLLQTRKNRGLFGKGLINTIQKISLFSLFSWRQPREVQLRLNPFRERVLTFRWPLRPRSRRRKHQQRNWRRLHTNVESRRSLKMSLIQLNWSFLKLK